MALAKLPKPRFVAVLALLFTALPAWAVTTDLSVKMVAPPDSDGNPTTALDPGATVKIQVTVARPEITQDRPKTLTLSFSIPNDTDFGSISGCDLPKDFDSAKAVNPFVCTMTDPFPYDAKADTFGNTVEASIVVARKVPKTIPSACPTGALGDVTLNVTSDTTDPDTTNNSGSVALTYNPYADLKVTASAPASANVDENIEIVGSVTNEGPCEAPKVIVRSECNDPKAGCADPYGTSFLTFKSGTGSCASLTEDGPCMITSLAVGASTTFSKLYTVDKIEAKNINATVRASGFEASSGIADANNANDAVSTFTTVAQSSSGCSSAGSAGPGALLGLALALSLLGLGKARGARRAT
jgi:hypothetical protein